MDLKGNIYRGKMHMVYMCKIIIKERERETQSERRKSRFYATGRSGTGVTGSQMQDPRGQHHAARRCRQHVVEASSRSLRSWIPRYYSVARRGNPSWIDPFKRRMHQMTRLHINKSVILFFSFRVPTNDSLAFLIYTRVYRIFIS